MDKLETIDFTKSGSGWFEVDGKNYWVHVTAGTPGGLPALNVYSSPNGKLLNEFRGSSLWEGDDESNTDYARHLIRERC